LQNQLKKIFQFTKLIRISVKKAKNLNTVLSHILIVGQWLWRDRKRGCFRHRKIQFGSWRCYQL